MCMFSLKMLSQKPEIIENFTAGGSALSYNYLYNRPCAVNFDGVIKKRIQPIATIPDVIALCQKEEDTYYLCMPIPNSLRFWCVQN